MSLFKEKHKPHNNKIKCPDAPGRIQKLITNLSKRLKAVPSIIYSLNKKGTSIHTSFQKASYTIEAAVVLPLFITLMMFGVFWFRVIEVQNGVQQSISEASRLVAIAGVESEKGINTKNVATTAAAIAAAEVALQTNDKIPYEFIEGGRAGIILLGTYVGQEYVDIHAEYYMKFPIGLLGKHGYLMLSEAKCRKWVGFIPPNEKKEEAYAYLADNSTVYHLNINCTHLNRNVHSVAASEVKDKRNENGGKYYPCEFCHGKNNSGTVYITDNGTKYHSDMNCGAISRNIRKIPLEEAKEKYPPCSKCSGG